MQRLAVELWARNLRLLHRRRDWIVRSALFIRPVYQVGMAKRIPYPHPDLRFVRARPPWSLVGPSRTLAIMVGLPGCGRAARPERVRGAK